MLQLDWIPLPEPTWSAELMRSLNAWINSHEILIRVIPITSDLFVFTYPLMLLALYLYGEYGPRATRLVYKMYSLLVLWSAALIVVVNEIIQIFVDKSRPEEFIENKEFLLLSHVPSPPFPSDHAGVSAAVAMSMTIWAWHGNNIVLKTLAVYLWLACLIMSFSRVWLAIHWPMDVVAGIVLGASVPLVIRYTRLWSWWKTYCAMPLIQLQNWIWQKFSLHKRL